METEHWALLVAVLALLGFDGKNGWRFLKWLARGGKPAPLPPPVPVEVVPAAPQRSEFPAIAIHTDRKVIGRDEDLTRLRTVLASGKGAQITSAGAVLRGEGGRGKTTLARHYAEQMGPSYDGGCWVPAQTREGVFDALATFGTLAFELPAPEPVGAAHIHAVLDKIQNSNARLLFVFDNVHGTEMKTAEEGTFTYADLRPFLPQGDKIHLILTTRAGSGFDGFDTIPLDVLAYDGPDSAAVKLLLQEAGQADADAETRVVAQGLAAKLGGLPLALTIAGALAREGASFPELAERIGEILAADLPNGDYPDSIRAAVQLSLAGLSADARALLDVAAWWAPDRISVRLFLDAPEGDWWEICKDVIPEEVQSLVADPVRVRTGLRALRDRSLLQGGAELSLHRLTASVLRSQQAGQGWTEAQSAAVLLKACYPGGTKDPQNPHHWAESRQLTPHVLALWDKAEELWEGDWKEPDWSAMDALLNQCGIYLRTQGDHPEELRCNRASLRLKEARLGEDSRDVPRALGNLGLILSRLGEFAEADALLTRAVKLDETYRDLSAELAGSYLKRANLEFERAEHGQKADFEAAEWDIVRARDISEYLGDTANVARGWNNLGYLRRLQQRAQESAEADETALETLRSLPDANPVDLAAYAMNSGSTRLEAGQAGTAEGLLREAYQIYCEIFATRPDHQYLKTSAGWLTSCLLTLVRAGDDPEGRQREAREICARHRLDFEEIEAAAVQLPISPPK
ncbi:tetratricopeptide repeat protein [Dinoroseobacter sp. S76]|uniref:tetratricopeptide repeat protein n=1 Tax=Dinoroseobacter sp. S76 TaxID=3415124 RepID=UPI003C79FAB6